MIESLQHTIILSMNLIISSRLLFCIHSSLFYFFQKPPIRGRVWLTPTENNSQRGQYKLHRVTKTLKAYGKKKLTCLLSSLSLLQTSFLKGDKLKGVKSYHIPLSILSSKLQYCIYPRPLSVFQVFVLPSRKSMLLSTMMNERRYKTMFNSIPYTPCLIAPEKEMISSFLMFFAQFVYCGSLPTWNSLLQVSQSKNAILQR